MSEYAASTENLTPEETGAILGLRLLIARAANRDSLAWWDDESLTPPGGFLLERVFPTAPALAARSLALAAAVARHQAACTGEVLHLYHLDADNQDGLALRFAPLLPIPVPREPIVTMDALRHQDTVCTLLSWGGGRSYCGKADTWAPSPAGRWWRRWRMCCREPVEWILNRILTFKY